MSFIAFTVSAAGAALNAALYVADQHWYNLAAAIFCGLLAVYNLAEAGS